MLWLQCTDIIAESAGPAPLQRRRWASVGDSALSKGLLSLAAKSFWVSLSFNASSLAVQALKTVF